MANQEIASHERPNLRARHCPYGWGMAQILTTGATLSCTFGAAPSVLNVAPANRVLAGGMPAANALDSIPITNIPPFGMCMTPSNPMVAAATAAALGVLTPMPCIPVTAAPWIPTSPTTTIGPMPILDTGAKCVCNWGGNISVVSPAQATVTVG